MISLTKMAKFGEVGPDYRDPDKCWNSLPSVPFPAGEDEKWRDYHGYIGVGRSARYRTRIAEVRYRSGRFLHR